MKALRKTLILTVAALLVLLALVSIVVPRLVNTEAVRNAIESAVSRDLGGTLTYERVALSVLPRPRFVLRRPKIDIPRKISAAVGSVDIYPAILPLLTGKVRVKGLHLESPDVTVLLPESAPIKKAKPRQEEAPPGPTADAVLGTAAKHIPDIEVSLDGGRIAVKRGGRDTLLVSDLRARVAFLSGSTSTDHGAPAAENPFRLSGSVAGTIDSPDLPIGAVALNVSEFEAIPGMVSFSRTEARMSDLSLTLSGKMDNYLSARRTANMELSGTAGPNVVQWLRDSVSLSPLLTPRTPLNLSDTRIHWEPDTLQGTGRVTVKGGPAIDFDVQISPGEIVLQRLAVRDKESRAGFFLKMKERVLDASFSGNLTGKTLNDLFGHDLFRSGWIKGDMKARIPLDHIAGTTANGAIEGEQIAVPWKRRVPLTVDRVMLSARDRDVKLDPAAITLGSSKGVFTGTVSARDEELVLDLDLASREVVWNDLEEFFLSKDGSKGLKEGTAQGREETAVKSRKEPFRVRGTLRVNADALRGKRFVFQPVHGTITLDPGRTRYDVDKTAVCGIGVEGSIEVSRGMSDVSLNASAAGRDLAPTLSCLAGADLKVTGTFDLAGSLEGQGPNKMLMRSLAGKIDFVARNGRVYNDVIVVPILKYKKIADMLGDKVAEARKNGIPYDTFGLRSELHNGALSVKECVVKSRLLDLAANGTIDLVDDQLDITVLLAPFRRVDAVVKKIPLLGDILGGTLVTVPLRVQGPFKDQKVTPLPPSAISEGLLGIMRRTLEVPFKVVDDNSHRQRSVATSTAP